MALSILAVVTAACRDWLTFRNEKYLISHYSATAIRCKRFFLPCVMVSLRRAGPSVWGSGQAGSCHAPCAAADEESLLLHEEKVLLQGGRIDEHPGSYRTNDEPNRDDRRNLGIILPSMSNSIGGVIVWWIEARKNPDSIDCATAPVPILAIAKFQGEVDRPIS